MKDLALELFEVLKDFPRMHYPDNCLDKLNVNDLVVCGILYKNAQTNNLTQVKDLSEKMNITRPAVNTILNRLEDRGYIERFRTKEDRKSVYVQLTSKTYEIYNNEKNKVIDFMNEIVNGLGVEDTKKFIELIKKVQNLMEKR